MKSTEQEIEANILLYQVFQVIQFYTSHQVTIKSSEHARILFIYYESKRLVLLFVETLMKAKNLSKI